MVKTTQKKTFSGTVGVALLLCALAFGVLAVLLFAPLSLLTVKKLPPPSTSSHSKTGSTYIVGLSAGSTRACASVKRDGILEVIPNNRGRSVFKGNTTLETIRGSHDLICRNIDDPDLGLEYASMESEIMDRDAAHILTAKLFYALLRADAEAYLGVPITEAVATVPAYFNDTQRQAIKDAGVAVGLDILRVLNEPTAAGIAYSLDHLNPSDEVYAVVYDLGASTFDATLLLVEDGLFEILATAHDPGIGGNHFTDQLLGSLIPTSGSETRNLPGWWDMEHAKQELSTRTTAVVYDAYSMSPFILTRRQFEETNERLFRRTLDLLDQALRDANVSKDAISEVLLVGGSSHVPRVQELVGAYFGRELRPRIPPDLAISLGAAIQGHVLNGADKDACLGCLEIIPLGIGVEVAGGVVKQLIPRFTSLPVRRSMTFGALHKDQTNFEIRLFRGERALAQDNEYLASLTVGGYPALAPGVNRIEIEVFVEIDVDGLITLSVENPRQRPDRPRDVSVSVEYYPTPDSRAQIWEALDRLIPMKEAFAEHDQAIWNRAFAPELPVKGRLLPRAPSYMLACTGNMP